MRGADIDTLGYQETAALAAAGVCALCEEEIRPGEPTEGPYHAECLAESIVG